MTSRRAPRERTARRARQRELGRAADRLDRLAAELPGGSRRQPLTVPAASVVALRAQAARCLRCEGELEVRAEAAEVADTGYVLRRVDLGCRACHTPRTLWIRIAPPLPS